MSFESVNLPGHFIRHTNFELWLVQNDGSELFANRPDRPIFQL